MNRRRSLLTLLSQQDPPIPLPDGWEHLEYVYFDKAKEDYIDTGISPTPDTKVEVVVMGAHNDFSHDRFFGVDNMFLIGFQSEGCVFQYNKQGASGVIPYGTNGVYYVKFVKDGIHNHATILKPEGDVEIEVPDNTSAVDFIETRTMWVGRANDVKGWPAHNNRIKYLKIWKSGELVGDFIPITNGTIDALYNIVTGLIHYKNIDQGVFIQDIDGALYTNEEWTALATKPTANGVAVIGPVCSFVVDLKMGTEYCQWNNFSNAGVLIQNIVTTTDPNLALLDYKGKHNTEQILAQNADEVEGNKGTYAEYCDNKIFPNGNKGYFAALGEAKTVYDNVTKVNECITTLGGDIFEDFMATSTQYDIDQRWDFIFYSSYFPELAGQPQSEYKNIDGTVHAFTTL